MCMVSQLFIEHFHLLIEQLQCNGLFIVAFDVLMPCHEVISVTFFFEGRTLHVALNFYI